MSIAGNSNGATRVASIIKILKLNHCHFNITVSGLIIFSISMDGHQSFHTAIKTVESQKPSNTLI